MLSTGGGAIWTSVILIRWCIITNTSHWLVSHFQSLSLFCSPPLKSTGQMCQQGSHLNIMNITPHNCFKPEKKIYSKYCMLCSGTYLIKLVRRIHDTNPVCSRKVPTSSPVTSPQITKKWKSLENNLFSQLETKAEITHDSACVSL